MNNIPNEIENIKNFTLNSLLDSLEVGLKQEDYNSFIKFYSQCDLDNKIIINNNLKKYSDLEQISALSALLEEKSELTVSCRDLSRYSENYILHYDKELEHLAELDTDVNLVFVKNKDQLGTYSILENKASYIDDVKKVSITLFASFLISSGIAFDAEAKSSKIKEFKITASSKNFTNYHNNKLDDSLNDIQKQLVKQGKKGEKLLKLIQSLENDELTYLTEYLSKNKMFVNKEEERVYVYEEMIKSFYKGIKIQQANKVAKLILKYSSSKNIPAEYLIGILKKESDFNQGAYNPSGDFSIAQVNYEIWSKAYKETYKKELDFNRLKSDSDYAMDIMTDILLIHKKKESKDELWYARYHSKTPSKKKAYASEVNKFIGQISKYDVFETLDKINLIRKELNSLDSKLAIDSQDLKESLLAINNNYNNLTINRYVANIDDYD